MDILRTSSYIIPVKLEQEEGQYMLIHGYTGAMDIVSEDLLSKIKSIASVNNFSEPMLQTLLKRGYITTKTQEEEYAYVARMAKALHKREDILNTTFTWVVSYNCNFRCPYCFEERNKKDGKEKLSFTKEQVDIAYNVQEKIQPHKELRRNIITLYGGEPLLQKNKEIINYIVKEGQKRGYKFVAVTNGYEIEHFLNLLGAEGIYKLQISIDGTKEVHDQRRIHYKDHDTFDKIMNNIQLALDKGIDILIRMNSDGNNVDQYKLLDQFFKERGFFNYPKFKSYLAILVDNEEVTDFEHKKLSFLSANNFVKKQQQQEQIQDIDIYKNIYNALLQKQPLKLKAISCASQTNGYILDPLGNIYPCWEVVGKKEFIEGTYSKDNISWKEEVVNRWRHTDISQRSPCNQCKYALLCGGGCPYYQMKGKDLSCGITKKSFASVVNKAYANYK